MNAYIQEGAEETFPAAAGKSGEELEVLGQRHP
jgi:hypothetical protein